MKRIFENRKKAYSTISTAIFSVTLLTLIAPYALASDRGHDFENQVHLDKAKNVKDSVKVGQQFEIALFQSTISKKVRVVSLR
jgi:hypothetical protein